jgi:integral membrane protein
MLNTPLSRFRLVALLEGISYMLLFVVTMPLKYLLKMPLPNYIVGLTHAALFGLYVILLIQVSIEYKWSLKKIVLAFIASVIPLGTFYAASKLYPAEPAA